MSAILLKGVGRHIGISSLKTRGLFHLFPKNKKYHTIPAKKALCKAQTIQPKYIYLLVHQVLNCQAYITKLKLKINEYFMGSLQRDEN